MYEADRDNQNASCQTFFHLLPKYKFNKLWFRQITDYHDHLPGAERTATTTLTLFWIHSCSLNTKVCSELKF